MSFNEPAKRFVHLHRNKFLTANARSVDDFVRIFEEQLETFRKYKALGVKVERNGIKDDYTTFYTEDPRIAKVLGFEREDLHEG